MDVTREQWSGKLGFILAASGSAVGLGNLWKFPYITWNNEGGAFVLVYLLCIAVIGVPVMMSEILIGRRSKKSPASAFAALGNPRWSFVGWLGVVAGLVILAFYSVIAGWSLRSFVQCVEWSVNGYKAPAPEAFGEFLRDGTAQIALGALFLGATAAIVGRGISGGIERATRVLMPVLFAIMIYLVINVMLLDGFAEALAFLFRPDFSKLTGHSVLEALGHAFFTLSLGMGGMLAYGSYLQKKDDIPRISLTVAALDTLIALVACVIMFGIIFTVPSLRATMEQARATGEGVSSVGMLFVTLPDLFYTKMPGGALVGPLFYVLVAFAALSSTISLLEVVVASVAERVGITRWRATLVATALVFVPSVACALSLGASEGLSTLRLFGGLESLNHIVAGGKTGALSIFDHVAANWLLPLGGLGLTVYAGWVMRREDTAEELFGEAGA
ncbi:MAG: sodium-dependent transporter, partial [Nannocystaceae bacterium]